MFRDTRPYAAVPARSDWKRLRVGGGFDRLTHYLFRYPAKFHPPIARALLERYTAAGDLVLDPFCGSGTLLLEAATLGRPSIGLDVDPVAVLVARAKVHRYQISSLRASAERVLNSLERYRRSASEYERRKYTDLSFRRYRQEAAPVKGWIPDIPNLFHWFRKYVVVDLARIRRATEQVRSPASHKVLFSAVFASIIRNASNADPVPVSGLEVTSYMKKRDEQGRLVDPFTLFDRALTRAIDACEAFRRRAQKNATTMLIGGDAAQLGRHLAGDVDAVITSPPYHGAVDYYRRHKLEMFWLGQTASMADRLSLLHSYIGRPKVPQRHPFVAQSTLDTALAKKWDTRIRRVSHDRANAFKHYIVGMREFFGGLAKHVVSGGAVVLVVGHSSWNKTRIPTTSLFAELAGTRFPLQEVLWYPVKNRYMSYERRNNANINKEYVLVFRRATDRHRAVCDRRSKWSGHTTRRADRKA